MGQAGTMYEVINKVPGTVYSFELSNGKTYTLAENEDSEGIEQVILNVEEAGLVSDTTKVNATSNRIATNGTAHTVTLFANDTLESLKAAANGTLTEAAAVTIKDKDGVVVGDFNLAKDANLTNEVFKRLEARGVTLTDLSNATFTVVLANPSDATKATTHTITFSEVK